LALEMRHAGVYAVGDVTAIRLMNRLLLAKAGVFAEAEANVAAETLRAFR
jgi:NADH dehydrogenase FAD-containing subunit